VESMPKGTFLNLPQEKKDKIIEVAIDEFAQYSFQNASINRIVENAGIAKGSFYQYFEDKSDVFKYILNISTEKKLTYLNHILVKIDELEFFQAIRELYIGGLKFAQDHPKLLSISNDFVKNADAKLKEEIFGSNIPKSNKVIETLISKGVKRGELDPNIDIEFTAFILTSLTISIGEYFIKEVMDKGDIKNTDVLPLVDKMLKIFENGIRRKSVLGRSKNVEDRFY